MTKILTVGSSKQTLHRLATDIFEFCIKNNIQLVPEWIPRIDKQMADLMSKQLDLDDYMLDSKLFAIADIRWGPTPWIGSSSSSSYFIYSWLVSFLMF